MGSRKPMGKIKLLLIIFLSCAFLFLLILAGVAFYVAKNVFSESPNPPEIANVSLENSAELMKKVQPLMMQVLQSTPGQIDELRLTANDINTLVSMAADPMLSQGTKWPEGFNLKFRDGMFYCDYSRKAGFKTPFGSYVKIHAVWQPDIRGGNVDFKVKEAKIGLIEIQSEMVKKLVMEYLRRNPEEMTKLRKIIADMYVTPDGILVIRYYSYEIKMEMQNFMNRQGGKASISE